MVSESNKLWDGKLLGAKGEKPFPQPLLSRDRRVQGLLEGGDGVGTQELAQGDTKHLATLVEDGLHDTTEELFVAAEIGHIISRHADNSRLHLGWRVEDRGLDGEEVLNIVPRLDEDREDPIGFRARLGSHAQGYLTLNHARTTRDEVAVVEHFEENLRRDVVGIVTSKDKLATSKKFAEIHSEEVTGKENPLA